jgi:hypothetical protein
VFYSWLEIRFWLIAGCVLGLGIAGFHGVRLKQAIVRIPIRVSSVLVGLLSFAAMSLSLLRIMAGCDSHSEPVISPSGAKAARIETDDEGATGGGTGVAIYSRHGFDVHTVMYGTFSGVDRSGLQWIGDSTLEVRYHGDAQYCSDAFGVHVICINR